MVGREAKSILRTRPLPPPPPIQHELRRRKLGAGEPPRGFSRTQGLGPLRHGGTLPPQHRKVVMAAAVAAAAKVMTITETAALRRLGRRRAFSVRCRRAYATR